MHGVDGEVCMEGRDRYTCMWAGSGGGCGGGGMHA